MSKMRRNHLKALVLLAAVSAVAATDAVGQGYAGPVFTPSSLNFSGILSGTTSAVQTVSASLPIVTLIAGSTPLSIVSITFPTGFARSGGSCPNSGTAPVPCTIGVVFSPTAPGAINGNMVVVASINGGIPGTTNVALTGTALAGAPPVPAPSLGAWGLGLLLTTLMTTGFVFLRRR